MEGFSTHFRALHRVQHLSNVLGSGSSILPGSLGMAHCLAEDVPEHPTKILTPAEAVALIKDNDMITVSECWMAWQLGRWPAAPRAGPALLELTNAAVST